MTLRGDALGDQLSYQATSPGADRRTDGELALSGGAPRQQQIREVRCRDQQHETDGGHQGEQRRSHLAHHLIMETDETQCRRLHAGRHRLLARNNGLAFGFRLRQRDTVPEPRDAGEGHDEPLTGALLRNRQRQRDPDLGLAVRKVEALGHDADDGIAHIIERDQLAEDVRVSVVMGLPPGVAQHRDRLSTRRFFVVGEHPTEQRCRTQQREERGRHRGTPHPHWLSCIQVGERAVGVPGDLVDGLRILAPRLQRGARHERRHLPPAHQGALFPHPNQAAGIRVRQRSQQRGVDHAKHGGCGPDAQCEGGQRHGREPRALRQHPQAVSDVLEEGIHSDSRTPPPVRGVVPFRRYSTGESRHDLRRAPHEGRPERDSPGRV